MRSRVRSCTRTRCLNCTPPVNLGLSGIYSKAGRFFGGQELRSVQPLRAVSGNAGFPRDLPHARLTGYRQGDPATTDIARGYTTAISACTQSPRRLSSGPRACIEVAGERGSSFFQTEISSRREHQVSIMSTSESWGIASSPALPFQANVPSM